MSRSLVPLALVSAPPAPESPLAALFRHHSAYVAAVALRLLGRQDEVDDVVQDVFLSALRGVATLREPEAIKAWLATVTVRLASRRLRLRRLRSLVGLDAHAEYEELAVGANQEQVALLARIYRLLDELPVTLRIAWTLRHIEGESLDRVAQLCRCSLATAKRRILAAQAAIEAAVGDE
jgi:RNA polymerase sigma-70 factor (ECF subfamily)